MAVIFDYILGKLRLADAGGTPATTTTPGTVIIATTVEVAAGTDPDKVVTPATLATELAKKQDSLGMSAEGDAAKYLNQQGGWTSPLGPGASGMVEIISNHTMFYNSADNFGGRVAFYIGQDTPVYHENHIYRSLAVEAFYPFFTVTGGTMASAQVSGTYIIGLSLTASRWIAFSGDWASEVRFVEGYWYIHTWKWTDDSVHQDEYRAAGLATDAPWTLTWESSWNEGTSGVGGTLPTFGSLSWQSTVAWQDITPYGAVNA